MSSLVIRSAARFPTARVALSCVALAVLSACSRGGEQASTLPSEPAELTWARTALERNPRYEVLASDTQTKVFTVRDRSTGQVQTINLNDLAAAPIAQLKSASVASATPLPAPEATTAAVPAAPAAAAAPASPAAPAEPAQVDNSPAAAAERAQAAESNYTIDRTGGTLRVSGPGVSIVSSGRGDASTRSNAAGVRASEPIICEGKRMLKLDDRKMYVEGDAIIARGGCELYITNSTIVATGTGLIVEDAIVHVANSHIEGQNGSFNATDRAKMFVRTSTFEGVPRRAEFASVLDQGGNQYR
ncbi:hypothetical protein GCM10011487_29470 [Steroidobacter agaridevorans]|uniref:Organic solvent tolerance-like N-terminal domain-containing protein n=1 Tax=Steroidobacter agaridevorans TaxID=2695856 RepID=A0A829YCG2_9GAMM|nr:hypothetical protein [Steroidobacter agaridevorans]GFE80947.1 hypothetical protein GCM10011487_29470 [Steroidobacter agaridevorans]